MDRLESTSIGQVELVRRLLEPDHSLMERVTSTERRLENPIFRVEHMVIVGPDGKAGCREVVRHGGGVGVLAIKDNRMCLVRQWRVALGRMTLEIPAGRVNRDEDEEVAAARELSEETGLIARSLTLVARSAGSPGFTDEATGIYRAHGLRQSASHPDPGEFVDVAWLDPRAIISAASAGVIQDSKTIIAAYAALQDEGV